MRGEDEREERERGERRRRGEERRGEEERVSIQRPGLGSRAGDQAEAHGEVKRQHRDEVERKPGAQVVPRRR